MAKIGFIGLGHMGLPMAKRLLQAGHSLKGFDLAADARQRFQEAGGALASSSQACAEGVEVLITMLQQGQQVKAVCLGPEAAYAKLGAGQFHIDCSSIDVQTARELHTAATALGIRQVDAPVSGGVAGAETGRLTLMVGGLESDFLALKPIFDCLSSNQVHTGAAGNGQAAKICNNLILGISMIAISESFCLAEKLGLSPAKLFEVVEHASGQCWAMSHYVPLPGILDQVPANQGYQPGFTAAMMLKDLKLSQDSAAAVAQSTPLAKLATELYRQFNENPEQAKLDFSAIIGKIRDL